MLEPLCRGTAQSRSEASDTTTLEPFCVPEADQKRALAGARRVARKMHLNRFAAAVFMDGHGEGLRLVNRPTRIEEYTVWLQRFGVRDPALAAALDESVTAP